MTTKELLYGLCFVKKYVPSGWPPPGLIKKDPEEEAMEALKNMGKSKEDLEWADIMKILNHTPDTK